MIFILLAIVLVLVLTIVGKLIYSELQEKRKQVSLAKTYERLVMKNKLSIEETYVFNNRLIGFDRKNRKLLLVDHNRTTRQEECIALPQLDYCEIIRVKNETKNSTAKLFIELNYKGNREKRKFIFFDESIDKIVEKPSLAKRAEYWNRKINLHNNRDKTYPNSEYVI